MKYFKITKSWSVKAENETEAIQLIEASPDKYLESESVTRTEYKPRQETGWGASIRNQLIGGNNKR